MMRAMKVTRRRRRRRWWDEGADKMIQWNIIIAGTEAVTTAAAITAARDEKLMNAEASKIRRLIEVTSFYQFIINHARLRRTSFSFIVCSASHSFQPIVCCNPCSPADSGIPQKKKKKSWNSLRKVQLHLEAGG